MNEKIINSHRYKKTTKRKLEKAKKQKLNDKEYKAKLKYFNENQDINMANKIRQKKDKKKKKIIKTIFKVIIYILLLLIVIFLFKHFKSDNKLKQENSAITEVYNKDNEKVVFEENYDFKIGISKLDTTDVQRTKNMVLDELYLNTKNQLLSINKDYSINYLVATKVEKTNNKQYTIYINQESGYKNTDVLNTIEQIKQIGDSNIYYKNLSNVENMSTLDNDKLKVFLKEENPYFVYTLNFPVKKIENGNENKENLNTGYNMSSTEASKVSFVKNKSKSTLTNISLINYEDNNVLINDFMDKKLDVFFATTESTLQSLSKYDYNIKRYKDGETLFILGNKNSKLFSQKEVRQAISYALNREEIIKKINNNFLETIDIPFIYSNTTSKYDPYLAETSLTSNGWSKVSGVYTKNIDNKKQKLELDFLVNSSDSSKKEIAEMVKQMLEQVGIKVNINLVDEKQMWPKISSGNYDMVFANVYINDYPNITNLENHLNLNDVTNKAFEGVKQSTVDNISINIKELQNTLLSEYACIGIMARTTSVIYQKDIYGFEDTLYMKIFDFEKIGKIKQKIENTN